MTAGEHARRGTRRVVVDRDIAVVAQATTGAHGLRWGPIVVGFLGAFGLFILMSLLAVTIGPSMI